MQVARYEEKGQVLVTKSSELFSSQPVKRLSVNNSSWKLNLPTFRPNVPVVIRAEVKEVWTNVAIYSHAQLSIHTIGGQKLVKTAPLSSKDEQSSLQIPTIRL